MRLGPFSSIHDDGSPICYPGVNKVYLSLLQLGRELRLPVDLLLSRPEEHLPVHSYNESYKRHWKLYMSMPGKSYSYLQSR